MLAVLKPGWQKATSHPCFAAPPLMPFSYMFFRSVKKSASHSVGGGLGMHKQQEQPLLAMASQGVPHSMFRTAKL
jgi:hypothetical protein